MRHEAEMPARLLSMEQWRMICCRYYTVGQFVQGKQVLDVGCGAGLGLGYLSRKAKRVIGGDYDRDNLRCAKQHYEKRVELLSMNAHKLPFKDDSFDVVAAMEIIQYLHFDEFLDECYRVLRREGMFIFCLPNKDRKDGFQGSLLSRKYYSVPELFALLGQHQFDVEFFGAFPVVVGKGGNRRRLLEVVIKGSGKILDLMPKGKEVKDFLGKFILHMVVLKEEIEDEDMRILENVQLIPIPCDSPDFDHKILYAIAHAHESKTA